METGIAPEEIGLIVRSQEQLPRAQAVAENLDLSVQALLGQSRPKAGLLSLGVMQLAKGLEFRAVAVMACDAEIIPLEIRVESAETQDDLDEIWQTERQLLYVAATRARENLLLSGVSPVSEYFDDLV